MRSRDDEIRRLGRSRPRSRFVRWGVVVLLLLAVYAWADVIAGSGGLLSDRSARNLSRFLEEIRPHSLDAREFIAERGLPATTTTLAISVAAIVLAGALALLLGLLATRTLSTPEPYAPGPKAPHPIRRRHLWSCC